VVTRLAAGADLLIHETAGDSAGHSTASQAAKTAEKAGVRRLMLIHYPVDEAQRLITQAAEHFRGEIFLAEDLLRISLTTLR
jgi:ribonuclease Z